MIAIAGPFVDPAAGMVETLGVAIIGVIRLPHWIFEVVLAASAAARRPSGASTPVDRSVANQTPLVHSISLLTHTEHRGHGPSAAATAKPDWVSPLGYPEWVPLAYSFKNPPAPQRRQRRWPSMLAVTALHGGPPR
jgi:hypothetical protein